MASTLVFPEQLKNLQDESDLIAFYVYAEMTSHHLAVQSKEMRRFINRHPRFWNVSTNALQVAAYFSLARVFDRSSRFNLDRLIKATENEIHLFTRSELRKRKIAEGLSPSYARKYVRDAHEMNTADLKRIKRAEHIHRQIYSRAVDKQRHQYLAHRVIRDERQVSQLFAQGTVDDLWRLSTFLEVLYIALWNQYMNGLKISLRQPRRSSLTMLKSPRSSGRASEIMVSDTRNFWKDAVRDG